MRGSDSLELNSVALIGSYVPRRCGIATFTKDLRDSVANLGVETLVLAMDDVAEGYEYPNEVKFQLRAFQRADYVTAADVLNINQVDALIVQHEYGIYGGPDGWYVLDLMNSARMPIITTLHTVLTEPSEGQAQVMLELAKLSERLVVMSHFAAQVLQEVYEVPRRQIAVIPHGIPDVPFVDPVFYKDQFGLEGRKVMLTFGLMSPGKGIEYAIQALPKIRERHPDLVYVVLGATHPHVLKKEGNAYRNSLERLADKLGVRDQVVFHNRFVTLEELCGYIGAADLYVTPYLNKMQIVSGTLAYAAGAGKAVLSTPYWYAEELLADERGRLIEFKSPQSIANAVTDLLNNELELNAMRKRAYMHCRPMVWKEVGQNYLRLAREVLAERCDRPRPVFYLRAKPSEVGTLPEVNLAHLRHLTDDTGILQHAVYAIPDRHHGYCSDDNSRAIQAVLMHYDLYNDDTVLPLLSTYFSFLYHAFDFQTKRFRNFMSYDRRWLPEEESEDVHGRCVNALGWAASLAPNEPTQSLAVRLLQQALEPLEHFVSPRAIAFAIVGIHRYLQKFQGDSIARRIRADLAYRLHEFFARNAGPGWPWCEEIVTYDNAKLPHALILSGQWIPDSRLLEQGLQTLEWLVDLQLDKEGTVRLIGNRGWLTRDGHRAHFDQQPIEVMSLIEACAEVYRCTQDKLWLQRARAFLGWFLGNNDTQTVIYDFATGGCRDGLHPDGPNLNEGAESTLAWLISILTVNELYRRVGFEPAPKIKVGSRSRGEDAEPTAEKGSTSA